MTKNNDAITKQWSALLVVIMRWYGNRNYLLLWQCDGILPENAFGLVAVLFVYTYFTTLQLDACYVKR